MTRPLRLHAPGLLCHVVARGDNKQCIFATDRDYEAFIDDLAETADRFAIECVSYCLLWNHYHLLLCPSVHPISRMMQQLNSRYCQRFNRRHGRVGHVLQGRFSSRIVEDGAYARAVLRYIALNPVEACRAEHPSDWTWSSYRAAAGLEPAPAFLSMRRAWEAFGTSDAAVGRARFVNFVAAGVQEAFFHSLYFGSDALARHLAPLAEPERAVREFTYSERTVGRPPLQALFEGKHSRRDVRAAAVRAYLEHAYTLEEIGRVVRRAPSTIWRWVAAAGRTGTG